MEIEQILAERQKTHGDFSKQSATAQRLKSVLRNTPNWHKMPDGMREGLELICTKLSRMGHGSWEEADHLRDGAGYFTLIERDLSKSPPL